MDDSEQVKFSVRLKKYSLPAVKNINSEVFNSDINPEFRVMRVVKHPSKKDSFIVLRKSVSRKGEANDFYIATEAKIENGKIKEEKSALENLAKQDILQAIVIKDGGKNVVSHLEVSPEMRNKGVGSLFLDHMMEESLKDNTELHFPAAEGHPLSFYEARGFSKITNKESADGYSEKFAITSEALKNVVLKKSQLHTVWPAEKVAEKARKMFRRK